MRFRRMVRQGIKAVKTGKPVGTLQADSGGVVPTYTQDTVLPIASAGRKDRALVREVGRRVAEINLKSAHVASDRRADEFARLVRELGY